MRRTETGPNLRRLHLKVYEIVFSLIDSLQLLLIGLAGSMSYQLGLSTEMETQIRRPGREVTVYL